MSTPERSAVRTHPAAPLAAGPVALNVHDLDGVARFYRDALGLEERERSTTTVSLGTEARELVALHHAPDAPVAPAAAGLFHVAILYPTRRELADAILRAAQAGARLDGASDHLVSEAVYLRDPEGNGIELYRDRPRDEWRREDDGQIAMATLPLDLDALLQQASAPAPSPVVAAGATVGHVHLQVADLPATRVFYAGPLGFDVMVEGYPQALFVATGGYHHHVGLNTWNSAGRPAVAGARGLRHATLPVADAATLGITLDRLDAAGVTIEPQADGASIVRDPSGTALRLALA